MPHSLLDDACFTIRTDGEHDSVALPAILHRLTTDNIVSFDALQTHQQQPWYAFLVQLAAMGVARENEGSWPESAEGWRTVLLQLADNKEAAWHLVVENPAEPAFLQSPIPEGSLDDAGFKSDTPTPDQLDVLITSKNHDVKSTRVQHPNPEHWIYALCALQTMEGFLGFGNYGVVRMNGGFGNRPLVGLAPDLTWGARFRRDVQVLLEEREELGTRYDLSGHALLWLPPWDGKKSSAIPLKDCDPYFIEVCRRIRLTMSDGEITCWRTNTKGQRVDAPKDLNGITGDPWTPIEKKGAKALTLGESGFTYDLIQQLILGSEFTRPPALEIREGDGDALYLVARTLVRGQGKTDGLHKRIVPIPKKTSAIFRKRSERELLAKRAQARVALVDLVRRKVLYSAIAALVSSGRDERPDSDKVSPYLQRFTRAIDARFFDALWASVEMGQEEATKHWQHILKEEAEQTFEEAKRSTPIAAIHRWKARSKAQSFFESRIRTVLDAIHEPTTTEPEVA
ncbi:MAG: type I-E CRISPR-associated protein Cse1/CasA [Bacteroidetes bacterium]|jgi:CRISPR system Cascade subunit CasA|nr:type I-E CRISPR-associated protein Cse1/CasA [Bacteroidota bacterium]